MLVRLLELGEAPSDLGQVVLGFLCDGVLGPEDAPQAPNRVFEEFLGKHQFVSRRSIALQDRMLVTVSQPEGYLMVGTEHASRQGKQWARERHRLTGVACFDEYN